MKRVLSITAVVLLAAQILLHAQDETTTTPTVGEADTNAPTMAELMMSNNIVTNTVGMVFVKISPELWADKYDVTQRAYEKVAGANPSVFPGSSRPVDSVSWNSAMAFCQKLTTKEHDELPPGFAYSLPTESQWETLVGDASLDDAVTAYNGTSHGSTAPVGSLGPNNLGLYDMRGNVMAWCLDSNDPTRYKVLRGAAWDTFVEPNTRIVFRNYAGSDDKKNDYGFRVVLEPGGGQ